MAQNLKKLREAFGQAAAFTKKEAVAATKLYFQPVTATWSAAKRGIARLRNKANTPK